MRNKWHGFFNLYSSLIIHEQLVCPIVDFLASKYYNTFILAL
jgi:hypothetical protein